MPADDFFGAYFVRLAFRAPPETVGFFHVTSLQEGKYSRKVSKYDLTGRRLFDFDFSGRIPRRVDSAGVLPGPSNRRTSVAVRHNYADNRRSLSYI